MRSQRQAQSAWLNTRTKRALSGMPDRLPDCARGRGKPQITGGLSIGNTGDSPGMSSYTIQWAIRASGGHSAAASAAIKAPNAPVWQQPYVWW